MYVMIPYALIIYTIIVFTNILASTKFPSYIQLKDVVVNRLTGLFTCSSPVNSTNTHRLCT